MGMAKRNAKKRQKYAEKQPKTYKGKKRGRKPVRANARYIPFIYIFKEDND